MFRFVLAAMLTAIIPGIAGCGAVHTFQTTFHLSFRTSFKAQFLNGCYKGAKNRPNVQSYCKCAEARVEKRYSDQELIQLSTGQTPAEKQYMHEVVRACILEAAGHK